MIGILRVVGIVLIGIGVLVIASWLIEPFREIVPHLIIWFQALPVAMQIGFGLAAVGFVILFSSIVWERIQDQKSEQNLLDD